MHETHHAPHEPIAFRLGTTLLAFVLFLGICLWPGFTGLPPAGQRLAGVVALMALLWSTQALPLAVTSLIPLVAFPLLQIQSADVVSQSYMNATILLYFSGFAIAIGVERWGLHRRLALLCLMGLGTSPRRVVLAFMLGTAVISMWISNTAATLLMLPIALAVLTSLTPDTREGEDGTEEERRASRRLEQKFAVALLLGIAYSSSIGGMCTLIGTPTNGVYAGYWASVGADPAIQARYAVSSGQWFVMFLPLSAAMFFCTWGLLCLPMGRSLELGHSARQQIVERYRALGRMHSGERRMLGVFLMVAILWLTRASLDLGGFVLPGWEVGLSRLLNAFFPGFAYEGWLRDSTVGLVLMIAMFLIPATNEATGRRQFLMDWETIEQRTPWGVLLLFGGGFALASACSTTGLSSWLGEWIAQRIATMSDTGRVLSVSSLVIFLTEFTSNTATIATLLPILENTATALAVDPRLLMLPATIAASCAFMLPIATSPNAIVFSSNRLTVLQMLVVGFWLNLLGILVITFFTMVWVLRVGQVTA